MLCGGPCIALFSSTELERLVCGTPLLDFGALQGAAKYEGFTREDQVPPPLPHTPPPHCAFVHAKGIGTAVTHGQCVSVGC